MSTPSPACCVCGVDGDVCVRPAGLVHLLLCAQGDPTEEPVFLWAPVQVVGPFRYRQQDRELLQISQGLL
eukprot:70273-Prorocentrum_minimum.AAC.1